MSEPKPTSPKKPEAPTSPSWTLVGREWELKAMAACLAAERHVLLEGPVGVGKTAMARVAAESVGRGLFRVDGDGRYTESRLVGQFDPPLVLERGYVREAFLPGPLVRAMQEGAVLLLNELNRMPEGVQNVLAHNQISDATALPEVVHDEDE